MEELSRHAKLVNRKVNIIIVNYNCWMFTIECISSLLKSTNTNFNVFIIDNQSTDNSINEIKEWSNHKRLGYTCVPGNTERIEKYLSSHISLITLIKNNNNDGFGAGNNVILKPLNKIFRDEYVWLLNPDTEVEPEVLQDLLYLSRNKQKILVGNIIHYFSAKNDVMYCGGFKVRKFIHGVVDVKKEKDIQHIEAIAGASIFTHISTFQDLGVLPEDYFMYWEETDFCTKAKQAGYTFEVNTKSKIFDHVGATSNSNFLREYLYLLNGLRFYKKYYLAYLPIILMSTIAKYFKSLVFEDNVKQQAIFYAHIDFFKILFAKKVDVLQRIQTQNKKLDE